MEKSYYEITKANGKKRVIYGYEKSGYIYLADGRPLFSKDMLESAGMLERVESLSAEESKKLPHDMLQYIFKLGDNNGTIIVDKTARNRQTKLEKLLQEHSAKPDDFTFEHIATTQFDDEGELGDCYHYRITHKPTGRKFNFTDRNLFDFGRVVNPDFGGIAMETEVGWYWNRYDKENVKMDDIEVIAYKIALELGFAANDIRL